MTRRKASGRGPRAEKAAACRLGVFRELSGALVKHCGYKPEFELNHLIECLATGWGGKVFGAAFARRQWLAFVRGRSSRAPGHSFDLFMATPYCAAKCDYCRHFRAVPGPRDLREYAERLARSMKFYAGVFRRIVFRHVYFGGGTPSLFDEKSLGIICSAFRKHVRFDAGNEATVEVNPASAGEAKLRMFRDCGFNRLSIGVQSLAPAVLRSVNRESQSLGLVKAALGAGRRAGFKRINIDLIVGLPGKSGETFFSSFRTAAALGPDTIQVYPCEPTASYLQKHYGGDVKLFEADIEKQREYLLSTARWAVRNGYETSLFDQGEVGPLRSLPCVEFRKSGTSFMREYDYGKKEGVKSVFGLGHHANSYIFGRLRYHSLPLGNAAASCRCRGGIFSRENEMQAHVLERFGVWKPVSRARFEAVFGARLEERFPEALAGLSAIGNLRTDGDEVHLVSEVPGERLACAMFFLRPAQLKILAGTANRALGGAALRARAGGRELRLEAVFSAGGSLRLRATAPGGAPADGLSAGIGRICAGVFRSVLAAGAGSAGLMERFEAALAGAFAGINRDMGKDFMSVEKAWDAGCSSEPKAGPGPRGGR